MKKKRDFSTFEKALIGVIPLTLVLSIILLFITKNQNGEIKSLLLGSITSIVLNYWHYKMTFKVANENPLKLKKMTILSYTIRYLVIAGLIVLGYFIGSFNPIYIVFGFTEYPLLLVIITISSPKGV